MQEDADQKNYEFGQFSRSGKVNIVFREKIDFFVKTLQLVNIFFKTFCQRKECPFVKVTFLVKMHQFYQKLKKPEKKRFFARPANLLKKRRDHRGFPKFFNTFLYNTSGCVFKYAFINSPAYSY